MTDAQAQTLEKMKAQARKVGGTIFTLKTTNESIVVSDAVTTVTIALDGTTKPYSG